MGAVKLRLHGLLGLGLLAAVSACAGKSTTAGDTQQAGGGSADEAGASSIAGGTSNGGTSNGGAVAVTAGAAAVSDACPAEAPASGSACHYVGDHQCNYAVDQCSSLGFVCVNGVWLTQSNNDGASLTCANYAQDPLNIPRDGDSCACRGTLDCRFDQCGTSGEVHAACDNTTWHVSARSCADAPCGPNGLRCKVGEACVVRPSAGGADYECALDPCAEQSQTLSCDCASSLCHSPTERCTMNNDQVECLCDTC